MALKRLLIIRPGETDWNLAGRWQGWVASPLNDHGKLQTQRLAHFMRNIGIDALYSSDNKRAVDTAEIITTGLEIEPVYDDRLRERSIGHWQGLTVPEIHGWYPDEFAQLREDPENYQVPGGESVKEVKARVMAALKDIMAAAEALDGQQTVCIISHTTAIRAMLGKLTPNVDISNENFGNTAVTTLVKENGDWRITAVNDQMHLDGLESRYMPEVRGDS